MAVASPLADVIAYLQSDGRFVASGTLDILNGDSCKAEKKFDELSQYLKNIMGDDSRYILLYSEYYLCLIRKSISCDRVRQEALSGPVSNHIKRWLPLPDDEVTDEIVRDTDSGLR